MTQVNFYTLNPATSEQANARLQFACRLAEKTHSLGHRLFILAASLDQARQLDDMLWQFRPASFIPHKLQQENEHKDNQEAVVIGTELPIGPDQNFLINLGNNPCEAHQNFQRISEIVGSDDESLARGRDNYRYYKAQGYQPETHKL